MNDHDPDVLIHPSRGKKDKPLPEHAVFFVNPFEAKQAMAEFVRCGAGKRILYNSGLAVDDRGVLCLAGPALGAAAAVLVLEKLIVLGVKKVLVASCCGTVDPSLSIGDLVLATSAVCGEGVSSRYGAPQVVRPHPEATAGLRDLLGQTEAQWREGAIWSTDAPYRERRSELFLLRERCGVLGVDMELSGLCAVAAFRGVQLAGLFIVSDELWGPAWKPGFAEPLYRERGAWLIRLLIRNGFETTGASA